MKKRPDGRYETTIRVNDKTIHLYGATQKELKQKVAETKASYGMGVDVTANKSLSYWIDMFLKSQSAHLTDHELQNKTNRLNYFKDKIGKMSVESIKPFQIEEVLCDIANYNPTTGKPSSDSTVGKYALVIKECYAFAIKNRICVFNPCDNITVPKRGVKKERRALTDGEIELISKLDTPAGRLATFAIYTGLRRGELASLQWNDIDLQNKTVTVCSSYSYIDKVVKEPKTKAGTRIVPLNNLLVEQLSKVPAKERHGIVFKYKGGIMKGNVWQTYQEELLLAVDEVYGKAKKRLFTCSNCQCYISIEPFDWHCFRHTFATLLYDKNIPVKVAQKWLGHANLETTMEIYTHLSQTKNEEAIVLWE